MNLNAHWTMLYFNIVDLMTCIIPLMMLLPSSQTDVVRGTLLSSLVSIGFKE